MAQARRRHAPDWRTALVAAPFVAVLVLTCAWALGHHARSTFSDDQGATSRTLDEAFSTVFGGTVALGLAAAAVALVARSAPILTAMVAAGLAYVFGVVPVLIVTGASNKTVRDYLLFTVVFALPAFALALAAAAVGALLNRRSRS